MFELGYYFLKADNSLVYVKGSLYFENVVRERNDPDTVAWWKYDSESRYLAWTMLIEAGAGGANPERIRELSIKWGMLGNDIRKFAEMIDVEVSLSSDMYWTAQIKSVKTFEVLARRSKDPVEALILLGCDLKFAPKGEVEFGIIDLVEDFKMGPGTL